MHELGLCEAVVEAVCRRAKGRPVAWARVRVGGHAVDPDVIAQGVVIAAVGTEAADLEVEVLVDPMRSRCGRCGREFPASDPIAFVTCPACGGFDLESVGSEGAVLEAVAYRLPANPLAEVPPPPASRPAATSSRDATGGGSSA